MYYEIIQEYALTITFSYPQINFKHICMTFIEEFGFWWFIMICSQCQGLSVEYCKFSEQFLEPKL